MKYEGLTQSFVNLIDDYKIDKFDKLINSDAKSIKGFIKSLIKMDDDLERQCLNLLTPIDTVKSN